MQYLSASLGGWWSLRPLMRHRSGIAPRAPLANAGEGGRLPASSAQTFQATERSKLLLDLQ